MDNVDGLPEQQHGGELEQPEQSLARVRGGAEVSRDEAEARHHREHQNAHEPFDAGDLAGEDEPQVHADDEQHEEALHVVEEGLACAVAREQRGVHAGGHAGVLDRAGRQAIIYAC